MSENQAGKWELSAKIKHVDPDKAQQKILHATIKKVTQDIESLSFNTAISQMMIFVNAFTNVEMIPLSTLRSFLILLNPFAPHIASELWESLNAKFTDVSGDITQQSWPAYDERLLVEDEVEIVIQVNGKLRDRIKMPVDAPRKDLEEAAKASPKVKKAVGDALMPYVSVITVPNKIANVVIPKPEDKNKE
jgi:leucyl-tRNA synthetase